MTADELKELAAQLRQPSGEAGLKVAQMMNESNIGMSRHAIDRLALKEGESVMELGHGNAHHLEYLLKQAAGLHYSGLELSQLMHSEARRLNEKAVLSGQAAFHIYEGGQFPFPDASFDKIFTVNTLYFWERPSEVLLELARVLKPGGLLNITFGQKSSMERLPFTFHGFELYDDEKVERLIAASPFEIAGRENCLEKIRNKMGQEMEREFSTFSLQHLR